MKLLRHHSPKNRATSFNIQNPSHTKSQKTKESAETRRAAKRQRVSMGVLQSNKECGKAPAEGSDRHLGPRCRRFKSCRLDQKDCRFLSTVFLQYYGNKQ
jgi:hypothetical protein